MCDKGGLSHAKITVGELGSNEGGMGEIVVGNKSLLPGSGLEQVCPVLIRDAGEKATYRFVDFFVSEIKNKNTRRAYLRTLQAFLAWVDLEYGLKLEDINSLVVSLYLERSSGSAPTKNQRLAALRSFFAWMVKGGILSENPAAEIRGIKHKVTQGKTPVLSDDEMRELLASIDTSHVVGLRDLALIGVMFFSFARVGAVLGMNVEDYMLEGRRAFFRLHEKGGKYHKVPAHRTIEGYLDEYIKVAGISEEKTSPLFRTTRGRSRKLTENRLQPQEALAMVKRRAKAAGVNLNACNHSFRASGITNFLNNGGSRDNAQRIAAHEDVRTTALYDRRGDEVSQDEIERIRL
jgi:integrase/recombinase XerD